MALSRGSKGFLLVLVVLAVGAFAGLRLLPSPAPAGDAALLSVTIPEGTTGGEVSAILEEAGWAGSPLAFRVRTQLDERANRIQAGEYEIASDASATDILEQLSQAPEGAPTFSVTIPEGLLVSQTMQRIAEAEGSPFTAQQLLDALVQIPLPEWVPVDQIPAEQPYPGLTPYEGLLFPNTYDFRVDATPQDVLQTLMDQTDQVLDEVGTPPDLDRYQVLTMGSLIEREARVAEEQPRISAVMHNRLEVPMRLQIDATVLYVKADPSLRQVLSADLEIQSPWSTYTTDGLPPTPISGAGESAIRAAAQPAEDPASIFYVVNSCEGTHAFAPSLEEHNRNVAAFRQLDCSGDAG